MKALKSKVILSAAVLFFALIATVGSTYAWFTVSQTNTVQALTLNVQTADSLLIRVAPFSETQPGDINDASAYFTQLTEAQITSVYTDIATWRLAPVTAIQTGYASLNGSLGTLNYLTTPNTDYARLLSAIDDGTPAAKGTDVNSATGKVAVLKFWVMSQSANMDLYLSDLTMSIESTPNAVKDEVLDAIKLSVQVGANAAQIYGIDSDYDFAYTTGLPGFYSGTQDSTHFNSLTGGGYDPTTLAALDAVEGTGDIIALLSVDTPTLVVCTIYLEGWDAETTNNVNAADFNISFTFGITAHV